MIQHQAPKRLPRDETGPHSGNSRPPLVTALICNYNYGRFLADAIDSALTQTWANIEVIVVDDGSTDNSHEVLAQYSDRIRVILKENGGQASAFNVGIAAAQGEIICFLDSDDLFAQDKLERVVDEFRTGNWGIVCHRMLDFDENFCTASSCESSGDRAHPGRAVTGDVYPLLSETGYRWIFQPTSAISVTAAIARQLIPLPEEEWRICADNPLAYGASLYGPLRTIDKPLGFYRIHGENGFASDRARKNARFRVQTLLHPVMNYQYLVYLAGKGDCRLAKDPDWYYPAYRRRVFAFAENPFKQLPKLFESNIGYHRGADFGAIERLTRIILWSCIDIVVGSALLIGVARRLQRFRADALVVLSAEIPRIRELAYKYREDQ